MKHRTALICLILLWGPARWACAQNNYSFELVTLEERANFGDVRNIFRDRAGVVWMGVFGKGLAYYDGRTVTLSPLAGDGAFSLRRNVFTAGTDVLYLNYGQSVRCFDPVLQRVVDSIGVEGRSKPLELLAFSRVGEDRLLWAVSPADGAQKAEGPARFEVLLSKNGRPFRLVPFPAFEAAGEPTIRVKGANLIVKIAGGFEEIDQQGQVVRSAAAPGLDLAAVFQSSTMIDDAGNFWFGFFALIKDNLPGHPYGLYRWDAHSGSISLELPLTSGILALQQIGSEIFIVGRQVFTRQPYGVDLYLGYRFTPGGACTPIVHSGADRYDMGGLTFSLLPDSSGIIWLGGSQGLGKLTPVPALFERAPLLGPRGITEDEAGNIYAGGVVNLGLDFGRRPPALLKGNPARNEPLRVWAIFKGEEANREIFSLNYDDGHMLWSNQTYDVRNGAGRIFLEGPAVAVPHLQMIDRNGRFWSISWYAEEMSIYDKKTGQKLRSIPVAPFKQQATEMDFMYQRPSDGTVWLGTHGQGIFVFSENGDWIAHYSTGPKSAVALKDNIVTAFYEDKNRQMWIGHGAGMSRLSPETGAIEHLEIVPEKPWLNLVYGILPEDDDRFLWISTNRGLYRYDTRDRRVMDFPLNPVVSTLEYNRTSFYKSRSGWLFFGGIGRIDAIGKADCIVAFDPKKVVAYYENLELNRAEVILNAFSKYDGSLKETVPQTLGLQALDVIRLAPGDRFFQLEYTISDMRSPANNYYSHYLEDYDADWSKPTRGQNLVRYENLPPGTYRLHLAGSLSPQTIRQNERIIRVIVLPHWYQTWWARLAFALGIAGLFWGARQYELNRRLERQKAEHLRQLDQLKSRLYTNISHEFRTPLTVIMGVSETIKGHDKQKNLIRRNSRNLLRLITQLLDLSKLESGSLRLNLVQGDVVAYLRYLTESFYSLAREKGIRLTFYTEEECLVMDYDAEKMQHVAYNLLSNAIKFTPADGDGKVILHLARAERDGQPCLKLKIKDTGIGIPPEKLPRIFERFYQADDSSTRKEEGTGIGLTLTKELVDMMRGRIEVASSPGQGAEFTVWLPIANTAPPADVGILSELPADEAPAGTADPVAPAPENADLPLLLLIEDNADVVAYVRDLLQKDYAVHVARDGQAGIDLAFDLIPDVVISDLMMPKRDGFEVCETLKTDERTSHIPIILLTAKVAQEDKVRGLRHGADAFLTKPFDKEELFVRLEKLVALRRTLQQRYAAGAGDSPSSDGAGAPRPLDDAFLLKLRTAAEARLHDAEFGAPDLARDALMGQTQVYRKLKALTGQSPSQFIRSVRLHKSLDLLKSGELTISEIAYEVGFTDPNYFSRVFHEAYGRPPSDYRKT